MGFDFSFFYRFELKYFDPFLALDEFSGRCSVLLCFTLFLCLKNVMDSFCNGHRLALFFFLFSSFAFDFAVTAPAGFPDHPHRGLNS